MAKKMLSNKFNLKQARVLISNDDGVNAPGIKILEKIAKEIAGEVWVIAPETEQSATGHSLTLRRPLRIRKKSARHFAVNGTPTDCVLLAVNQIMKECKPDIVLSGINQGSNVGEDMTYSGTIAAAMEATLFGIPAIALSQAADDEFSGRTSSINFSAAETHGARVIKKLLSFPWPKDVLMNVNFPAVAGARVKGIKITREGRWKKGDEIIESHDPRGEPYYWIGRQEHISGHPEDTDLHALENDRVSVTPLSMDMTHRPTIKSLKDVFKRGGRK